ncbi:MAG: efflux RND transporter permease subunit [Gemmatimonadales bacterium]
MLDWIIRWSLANRVATLFAAAVLLLAGGYAAITAPVDIFPDLTAPTVTVLTDAHAMAPEEVELRITWHVETAMHGAPGVRRVRSSSTSGISIVWVEFDWGMDIFRARQIVSERLQMVGPQIPAGIAPPALAPITSIMGEVMLVGMTSDRHTQMEVRTAADALVRKRLLAVAGVAQVVPIGGEVKEYQVLVDPERMRAAGVTLSEVLLAATEAGGTSSGGVYVEDDTEVMIRGIGAVRSVEDLGQTVVTTRGTAGILLRDVAEIRIGARPRIGTGSVNAEPAVVLSIQRQPQSNTLDLTARLDAELDRLQAALPEGMQFNRNIFRQADFIAVAVENVVVALRDGALLVVLVLMAFLANARTTAISVLAIPLSLAAALLAMRLGGVTVNTMTLGGMAIAIGAVVDDAIIDVENTFRRLRENWGLPESVRRAAIDVVRDAASEVRRPILQATLIITVVFVPLFFLSGIEGRMLRPLGIAYIVSILASLAVALTVTPVLCAYLLPAATAAGHDKDSWLARQLKARYDHTLDRVLARPRLVMAGAAVAVVLALASLPFLGRGFLPPFQEGTLTISAVTLPGTAIEESDRIGAQVERRLLEHPAVRATARRTGRAELDEHAQGGHAAEIDVGLDLSDQGLEEVMEQLRASLAAIPGTNITIGQPIGHRIDHMLSGTRAAIAIKVFGPDLYELRRLAERVRATVESVPGIADLAADQQADVPQLRIEADRAALARHGVTPGALMAVVEANFAGHEAAQVFENQHAVAVVVRLSPVDRTGAAAIAALLVDGAGGTRVPLGQLARVQEDRGPNAITRENVQRTLVVQANVAGRDVGSVVQEIQALVAANVTLPDGYFIEYGGQFESGQRAARAITLLSVVSIAFIFLLLFQEFASGRTALLVMVNLPLALIGGLAATFLTGGVLNVATLVGFITLFGIAARNGILLVSHYRTLLAEGLPLREAVHRGSMERLLPILMTALTAALALIPLALGGGEPGKEIEAPMAIVVLGGLLTSTALNMVVVPALFYRFHVVAEQ